MLLIFRHELHGARVQLPAARPARRLLLPRLRVHQLLRLGSTVAYYYYLLPGLEFAGRPGDDLVRAAAPGLAR